MGVLASLFVLLFFTSDFTKRSRHYGDCTSIGEAWHNAEGGPGCKYSHPNGTHLHDMRRFESVIRNAQPSSLLRHVQLALVSYDTHCYSSSGFMQPHRPDAGKLASQSSSQNYILGDNGILSGVCTCFKSPPGRILETLGPMARAT